MPGVVTVPGVSRRPEYGLALADTLSAEARVAFRPGEGVWVAGPTAEAAASSLSLFTRERLGPLLSGSGLLL